MRRKKAAEKSLRDTLLVDSIGKILEKWENKISEICFKVDT